MQYIRQNFIPLLVAVAAVIVSVAAIVVAVDTVRDDDDASRVVTLGGFEVDLGELRDAGAIEELLEGLGLDDLRLDDLQLGDLELGEDLRSLLSGGSPTFGVTVDEVDGALTVVSVQPDSPAADAGVRPGDRIEAVDGKTIATTEELQERLAELNVDGSYQVALVRDGEALALDVEYRTSAQETGRSLSRRLRELLDELQFDFDFDFDDNGRGGDSFDGLRGRSVERVLPFGGQPDDVPVRPAAPTLPSAEARIGVTVDVLDGELRVASVLPGSGADAAGLRPGDAIVNVDGRAVHSVAELRAVLARHRPGDRVDVVLRRGRVPTVVAVRLSADSPALGALPQRERAVPSGGWAPFPESPRPDEARPLPRDPFADDVRPDAAGEFLSRLLADDALIERLFEGLFGAEEQVEGPRAVSPPEPPPVPVRPVPTPPRPVPTPPSAPPPPTAPTVATDVSVLFGRVEAISEQSITLTGELGGITFVLTPRTEVVGGLAPHLGGLVTVVADGREAVVVTVIN